MTDVKLDQKEFDRRIDKITVCGKNRGPHDYIPVAWVMSETKKHIEVIMCRVCFQRVHMNTLYENFDEAKV